MVSKNSFQNVSNRMNKKGTKGDILKILHTFANFCSQVNCFRKSFHQQIIQLIFMFSPQQFLSYL